MEKNLELEKLKKENEALKKQIADLTLQLNVITAYAKKHAFSSSQWTGKVAEEDALPIPCGFGLGASVTNGKRDKTKYEYQGIAYSSKRELVQKCVRDIIKKEKITSEKALFKAFPDDLQGSFGVIKSEKEINDKINSGKTSYAKNRFLGFGTDKADAEAIKIGSDRYFICNEWRFDNTAKFIKYVIQNFDIEIKVLG